jgi:UDP-N-acetylmuramate dehydrogenase
LLVVRNFAELTEGVFAAKKTKAPFRVIGNGSNVIFPDEMLDKFIIINKSGSISIDKTSGRAIVDSGVSLSKMILEAASNGLSGLENLYGIPGTVGGAIVVNAGAHGSSVGDYLKQATLIASDEKILSCKNKWFDFGYRESKLKYKKTSSPTIVLNAIFQFHRRKSEDILRDVSKAKIFRQTNQPVGEKCSGSIFRNPAGTDKAAGENIQMTAGYLLEKSGAKKMVVGGARVSKLHANWIINTNNATSVNIRELIDRMKEAVFEKFSVELEEEVEFL